MDSTLLDEIKKGVDYAFTIIIICRVITLLVYRQYTYNLTLITQVLYFSPQCHNQ